jgi:outer membrane protein assembly factor BamB
MRLLLLTLATLAAPPGDPVDANVVDDERLVRAGGVTLDGPGLLAFFRQRTLSDADYKRLEELIRDLGSEDFATREAASRGLTQAGPPVLPLLRPALRDKDLEVARRAQGCIEVVERGTAAQLPGAAARLLARCAPEGAVAVLFAYLPFADEANVIEEVATALLTLTAEGRADAVLMTGLADPRPTVRAVAAHVVGRKGTPDQRETVARLLSDPVAQVRWRAAIALLASRDRRAVPVLVAFLGDGPVELAWQTEDVLFRLAGDKGPKGTALASEDGRRKARDAWAAWWQENGEGVDLARFGDGQVLLGMTLAIEFNTGRVWECTPDGTLRLDLRGLQGPMEAQILPNGQVLLAESKGHLVSIRDAKGGILWSKRLTAEPTGCQRLPNGNIFVSTYSTAMEFSPDGTELYNFPLSSSSNAIWKARSGHILYAAANRLTVLDTSGKLVHSIPLPQDPAWSGVQDLPDGHFLVCSSGSGQIVEVDEAGNVRWQANHPGACGLCRLPNGRTLVGTANRIVELNQAGAVVWEKKTDGYVRRVHRR